MIFYWKSRKGCRNSRCTKDHMFIDKAVMKNCRRKKVGLNMVWIDYRKVYDMIPHSLIPWRNPWRCVKLQITYFIFCQREWKASKRS